MVLAVAALLLQFQSFAPPAQAVGAQRPVIHAVSVNSFKSFKESAPVSTHPIVAVGEDFIASTTESSSTHMNLDEVHLVNADSKNEFSSSLKTVTFETPDDAQSFSTVRIPEVSTKESKFREAISQPSRRQWLALALLQIGRAHV